MAGAHMIKRNSTFPLSAAVAARMTEDNRISFAFLFFAAGLFAQAITPTTKSKLNRGKR
jgi:hypothetical protein